MRASDALGRYGEDVAATELTKAGFTVVARNWRCREGEIDVLARDGSTLVVCEVKTRAGLAFGTPLEAVTPVKLARLRRLALRWLDECKPTWVRSIRVDVVGVVYPPGGVPTVEHVRGVVP
ncbi:MAG: YraN family protein [Actinomycetes bacterium]